MSTIGNSAYTQNAPFIMKGRTKNIQFYILYLFVFDKKKLIKWRELLFTKQLTLNVEILSFHFYLSALFPPQAENVALAGL